jgi:ATP-dependent RNA helicase RhlB
MKNFKEGRTRILLATDVASRGIHVEDISHVINYDLPQDPENYIHRIGRTARAGKAGRALSFASEDTVYYLEPIEKILGYKIPVLWPKDSWFAEDKSKTSLARRRLGRKRPDRGSGLPRDKKRPSGRKPGKMTIPQSKPDSIFGLAPGSKIGRGPEICTGEESSPKRKKRRGRRGKEDGPK